MFKPSALILFFTIVSFQSVLSQKNAKVSNDTTLKICEREFKIGRSEMIPDSMFGKLLKSTINNYILFNGLSSNAPAVKADILEKELGLEYYREVGNNNKNFLGLTVRTDLDSDKKTGAVFANGSMAGNLKSGIKLNHFFKSKGKYYKSEKDRLIAKLDSLGKICDRKMNDLKHLEHISASKDTCPCEKDLKFLLLYNRDFAEEKKKILKSQNETIDKLFLNSDFNVIHLHWLSIALEIGNPTFNTYDNSANIGSRIDEKSLFGYTLGLAYNHLWLTDYLSFFSIGAGFQRVANSDLIKSAKYTEEEFITSTGAGLVYKQKSEKAYKIEELTLANNALVKLDYVQIIWPSLRLGINETLDFSFPINNSAYKPLVSNSFGIILPILNKKDKIITMLQTYWKVSGRTDEQFTHEIGLKLGLPINLDKKTADED